MRASTDSTTLTLVLWSSDSLFSSNDSSTHYPLGSNSTTVTANNSTVMDSVVGEAGMVGISQRSSGDLLDKQTSYMVELVVNAAILPVVATVGVCTNILNMIIFFKQGLRDRINLCLFSLAVADTGYILAISVYKSFSVLHLISPELGDFWKVRSLNTIIGIFWGFSSTSNLHTMLISMDRCFCVVSPFHAKHLLKTKVTVVAIVIIYVCIIGGSCIFNVKFTVGSRIDPETNTTMYIAVLSKFYIENKVFVDLVYNYILAIAVPFASLVVVIICTTTTVIKLRMALTWKQESQSVTANELKEAAVTKMLLVVCYVYVVCITPSVVNAFVVQFVNGWLPTGRYSNTFYVYVALMHLLAAVNSSVNFFIYYSRGTRFRKIFWQLVCPCRVTQPEIVESNTTQVSGMRTAIIRTTQPS